MRKTYTNLYKIYKEKPHNEFVSYFSGDTLANIVQLGFSLSEERKALINFCDLLSDRDGVDYCESAVHEKCMGGIKSKFYPPVMSVSLLILQLLCCLI